MSTSNILRGTLILTVGTMLSRVLGLVYIFPFHAMVGNDGGEIGRASCRERVSTSV